MSKSVSLVTPTYHRDFESCRLLCDSVDAFVEGFDTHYLVVGDDDVGLFSPLASERRVVLAESTVLPNALHALPRFIKWKGRRYSWAVGAGLPVYGWHLQQLRKLAAAMYQTSDRVICLDSDICFVRPFDAYRHAHEGGAGGRSPLFVDRHAIDASKPNHVLWWRNAHRLVGAAVPALPGDDYIGHIIVWDRDTVGSVVDRIEKVAGRPWWKAICRARNFSEYLIYGVAVQADPALGERHELITESVCHSYWSGPALDKAGLEAFIGQMSERQRAICIQSHIATAPSVIRDVVFGSRM